MSANDALRRLGHPIAYYPEIARHVGVKAAVLLCYLHEWQQLARDPLGAQKTAAEMQAETALSYEEQRSARQTLCAAGVLIETERRLEHKMFFRVDLVALAALMRKARS